MPTGLLRVEMHGCDVIASSHARRFCIQVTDQSVVWIQSGLRRSVRAYIEGELGAMSHTSAISDGELGARDKIRWMIHMRAGVREKIRWKPETCRWGLKVKAEIGEEERYCKENKINLAIPNRLCGDEFLAARDAAFHDAVQVWNAIDKSGRKPITMPERPLKVQMVTLPYRSAMSHTGSDREPEQSDRDE